MGFVGVYLQKEYEEKVEKLAKTRQISLGKVVQGIVVKFFSERKLK